MTSFIPALNVRIVKESSWILVGQVVAVLGSLLGIRILTGFLDPGEYGELALAMTVSGLIVQIITGPLSNGITRFYAPAKENDTLSEYFCAVRHLKKSANIIISITMVLAAILFWIVGKVNLIPLIIFAFIFSLINGNNGILNGIQNAARQRTVVALHQGFEPWMRFLIAAILIFLFGSNSLVALIGYTIGISLVYFSQNLFLKRFINKNGYAKQDNPNLSQWQKQILNFSWPFVTWGFFTWGQLVSDRWALEIFGSTKDVGLYSVLYQLGYYPISLITGMAVQLLSPVFYQQAGDASDKVRNSKVQIQSRQLTILALNVTIIVFVITLFLHNWIFQLFVDKQYAAISYLLPWLLLSGGIFASGQSLTLNLQSKLKTRMLVAPKIITALAGVLFNFWFAYLWGIPGIVIASILFSCIYFIWMIILTKKTN